MALCLAVAACGYKGPLQLPNPDQPSKDASKK
jgi:predicted small lipoprotein YifL